MALPLLMLLLMPLLGIMGCGDDSSGTMGPGEEVEATHYEITVKMSSIWAQNDCENTPGNPGDFRWRLVISVPDEAGEMKQFHDTGYQEATIGDGQRQGIVTDDIVFLVPNLPGSEFQVEYWVGEYDPAEDFVRHSWATHRLDRGKEQMWAAGTSYEDDRYTANPDGSGSGLLKFAVWNTRAECSGAAYYYVTWTPTTPEPPANNPPVVGSSVSVAFSELDTRATVDLLANTLDPDGDPLDATNIRLATGDNRGVSIDDANNTLIVDPGQYTSLNRGESEYIRYDYDVADDRGASTQHMAELTILGHTPK
jgi:hypothetical protein